MRPHRSVVLLAPFSLMACFGGPNWGPLAPPGDDAGGADVPVSQEASDGGAEAETGSQDVVTSPTFPPIAPVTLAPGPAECAGGAAPQAYLLTDDATLLSFDPSSLSTRVLGTVACSSSTEPLAFTVSASGTAYILYRGGSLFEVNLSTLSCTRASYESGQLGLDVPLAMTVGAGPASDRLYYYGADVETPELTFSDLMTFSVFEVGALGPPNMPALVDLKVDAFDRLFGLANDGSLIQIDPATGAILGEDHTGWNGQGSGSAMLTWGGDLYFFEGGTGNVSRYDLASKTSKPMGSVSVSLVGAGSAPCVGSSASSTDAGTDAGGDATNGITQGANPFTAGQVWIGTYACPNGVTPAALAVDTVSGEAFAGRIDLRLGSPAVAASYEVSGTYNPATREAVLEPGRWIDPMPSSISAVGLDGFVSVAGEELSGTVSASRCGAFSLRH
jgi:hypothetical protein